jgi:hypothetical protein
MRPIYETESDRRNEVSVQEFLTTKYSCRYEKTAHLATADAILSNADGVPWAVLEVKTRKNSSTKYPTYMISANKVNGMMQLAEERGCVPLLVVKFTDGIFAIKLRRGFDTASGGRQDRGDFRDIETCVYIPMERFRQL